MKRLFTYRPEAARKFASLTLAALLLQVLLLKEAHHCLDDSHRESPACFANGAEKHLHGAEYVFADCPICFFNLSPTSLDFPVFEISTPAVASFERRFFYQNPLTRQVKWRFQLRAPPASVC
ncbi:MAG: hypothetical protein AAB316_17480 [Bacteroidota bacterium]